MYVRRKVYSVLQDEMGEERYFSTTDVAYENEVEERIYSASSEVEYEFERYFSDTEKEGMSNGEKAAIIGAATLGTAAATIYGSKAVGKKIAEAALKEGGAGVASKSYKVGMAMQKPGNTINSGVKAGYDKASKFVKETVDKLSESKLGKSVSNGSDKVKNAVKDAYNKVKNIGKKSDKAAK